MESVETSHGDNISYAFGYDLLNITANQKEADITFTLSNCFEPLYIWKSTYTIDDFKNDKEWRRFWDIYEIHKFIADQVSLKQITLQKDSNSCSIEFCLLFNNEKKVLPLRLKHTENKDIVSTIREYGKILHKQQIFLEKIGFTYIDSQSDISKKMEENISQQSFTEELQEKQKKTIKEIEKKYEDSMKIFKLSLENEKKIENFMDKFQLEVEKNEIFKVRFQPNNAINITATAWTQYGVAPKIYIPKNGLLKYVFEQKDVYSNKYGFFTKIRLYFTGPENFYLPDEESNFMTDWTSTNYEAHFNKRDSGFYEINESGYYTICLQGKSSNGGYMYITDPTFMFEISPKITSDRVRLQFMPGQKVTNNSNQSWAKMGNAVQFSYDKPSFVKWNLELKQLYASSYSYFHRIRLNITGPKDLQVPDANYGILKDFTDKTYNEKCNMRETGIFKLEKEGTYTVQLEGFSSNGNTLNCTDPTLYLEFVKLE